MKYPINDLTFFLAFNQKSGKEATSLNIKCCYSNQRLNEKIYLNVKFPEKGSRRKVTILFQLNAER